MILLQRAQVPEEALTPLLLYHPTLLLTFKSKSQKAARMRDPVCVNGFFKDLEQGEIESSLGADIHLCTSWLELDVLLCERKS